MGSSTGHSCTAEQTSPYTCGLCSLVLGVTERVEMEQISRAVLPELPGGAKFGKYCLKSLFSKKLAILFWQNFFIF